MRPAHPGRPGNGGSRPLPDGIAEAPGGEFFYRAHRLILTGVEDNDSYRRSRDYLVRRGGRPVARPAPSVEVFEVQGDILDILDDAERELRSGHVIEPEYVLLGTQTLKGGPFDDVHPASPPHPPWSDSETVGHGFTVGILDTGITLNPPHPRLKGQFTAAETDLDTPNNDPGQVFLDHEGGHGTFVAGLVNKEAPRAHMVIAKVLDADGVGTVLDVIAGIQRVLDTVENGHCSRLDVLNLSLGGYSWRDRPPMALWAALAPLISAGTVVVAAAGNFGSHRPFWPAAFPQVLAVGALDGAQPASFTNYGPWVDACAPGVEVVSTFFDETVGEIAGADLPPVGSNPPVRATFPGYARWSGTSFSAPKVAGAIVATASTWNLSAREAADRLVYDWRLFRVPDLGVVVNVG